MFCAKFLDKTASVQKIILHWFSLHFTKTPMSKRKYNKRLIPNNLSTQIGKCFYWLNCRISWKIIAQKTNLKSPKMSVFVCRNCLCKIFSLEWLQKLSLCIWKNFPFAKWKKLWEFGTQFFIFSFLHVIHLEEDEDDDNPYALWMPQSAHQSCPGFGGLHSVF